MALKPWLCMVRIRKKISKIAAQKHDWRRARCIESA